MDGFVEVRLVERRENRVGMKGGCLARGVRGLTRKLTHPILLGLKKIPSSTSRTIFAALMLGFSMFSIPLLAATNSYLFELELDTAQGVLTASERIQYLNNSSESLNELYFRLDFNLSLDDAMQILAVRGQEGRDLLWRYQSATFGNRSSEKGQMAVTLPEHLDPGGVAQLEIDYKLVGKRFLGLEMTVLQDDPYWSFDAWYPKAMTFHNDGWSVDDDRLADYEVDIEIPSELVIASTGKIIEEQHREDGRSSILLRASKVRGFTIYGCHSWKVRSKLAEDVELRCYVSEENEHWAERFLDAAVDAIVYYSSQYGEYPCKYLAIVAPGQGSGAFTACNVIGIFTGEGLDEQYRWLVAHEVAHQYFSVLVSQPRDEIPWIVVGLGMVMDRHYLLARGLGDNWHRMMMQFYPRVENEGRNTSLSQPVSDLMKVGEPWSFQWNLALAHGKAFAVCALLEDFLGEKRFHGVIKRVISELAGSMISSSDLIAYCEEAYGGDLSWFSADWVEGNATLDYAVTGIRKVEHGWEVEVSQLGSAAFPVVVEARTQSDHKLQLRVSRDKKLNLLLFETDEDLTSVLVDPSGIYPDIDTSNNTWLGEENHPSGGTNLLPLLAWGLL